MVVLAAGAAGGGLWAAGWRHDGGATKPKAAASPTAVTQLTALPPEYTGRWTGNAPNGPLINAPDNVVVNVTLARGPVGGVTGDVNYTRFNDYGNSILCGAGLKLVDAQPTGMKVVPLDPPRAGFCANPDAVVVHRPDDTLDWTGKLADGTPYIVTLHRV